MTNHVVLLPLLRAVGVCQLLQALLSRQCFKGSCKQLFIKLLGNLSIYLQAKGGFTFLLKVHQEWMSTVLVQPFLGCRQRTEVLWLFLNGICLSSMTSKGNLKISLHEACTAQKNFKSIKIQCLN